MPPPKASILIADDAELTREWLEEELGSHGYTIATAADGTQALAQLETREFDVLLTDLRMPGMDGLELLAAVRERFPDVETVILTADGDLSTALQSLRLGAFDFVVKERELLPVVNAIERAVERKQLRSVTALYQASQAILEAHHQDELPKRIVDVVMRVMRADDASLMLPGADGRLRVAASTRSTESKILNAYSLDGVASRVAAEWKPRIMTDAGAVPAGPGAEQSDPPRSARSSVVYPLLSGPELVGVLNVNRAGTVRPFRHSDLHLVAILASQSVLALKNQELLRRLVAADRLTTTGMMAAGIAHDVNNPIAYVLSNLTYAREKLATGGDVAAVMAALADAEHGAKRVSQIVSEVQLLAAEGPAQVVAFPLAQAIQAALRMTAAELRGVADISVDVSAESNVAGSVGRMTQVFTNLIVNAAHALEKAPERGRILITSREESGEVIVNVTDTGCGIGTDRLGRVFDPFFTTKAPGKGTGLGLPICRDIITQHGGSISVASEPGAGATFTIRLPLAVRTPARRPRILCVDDEPMILRGYERTLGQHYDVVTTARPRNGLQRMLAEDFDLILCDVMMPDLNGVDLYTEAMCARPSLCGHFVFATASMGVKFREFFERIPNVVLSKPVAASRVGQLLERVRSESQP